MLHTHKQYPLLKVTSGGCSKVLFFGIQRSLALGRPTTPGFGPNTFFLCLPEDHWIWLHWSVSVPFEELPNGCHAKQHNQPRHSVCVKYIGYATTALPPLSKTHSRYLNLALTFMSLTTLPQFPCLLLCLAAHFHSLSCLHPFCMCELGSLLPVHEGKLILFFCTYS